MDFKGYSVLSFPGGPIYILLAGYIEHKPSVHLHLLIIFFAFELEAISVLFRAHDLCTVEGRCIRVPSKNLLPYRK